MKVNGLPSVEEALQQEPRLLAHCSLLLKADEGEEGFWNFAGIASDSSKDTDGDEILSKSLDVSYAKKRGFVNWNHSREPEDQIGFIRTIKVIQKSEIKDFSKQLGRELSPSASLYVEGELYKHVQKAKAVRDIMKSAPKDRDWETSLISLF